MNAASSWLGSVVAVMAILAGAGSALAYLRASASKSRVDALRGDIGDRDKRIEFLEDENKRLSEECRSLLQKVDVLQGLATGRDHIDALTTELAALLKLLASNHQDSMATLELVLTRQNDVLMLLNDRRGSRG